MDEIESGLGAATESSIQVNLLAKTSDKIDVQIMNHDNSKMSTSNVLGSFYYSQKP